MNQEAGLTAKTPRPQGTTMESKAVELVLGLIPWRLGVLAANLMVLSAPLIAAQQSGAPVPASLQPFIKAHCIECHDADVGKGGLDLTALPYGSDPRSHERWVRVYDRVLAGEMPPVKKERPDATKTKAFLATLEQDLTAQHLTMRGTVLRRLNRIEYRNTIEDLLGQKVGLYEDLPEDALSHGFDTNGEALGLSDVHLRRYLAAAETLLTNQELRERAPVRTTRTLSMAETGGGSRALKEHMWLRRDDGAVIMFSAGQYPSTIIDNLKLTDGGVYTVRFEVEVYQSDQPMVVELWHGNFKGGGDHRVVGYHKLMPGKPQQIELTTWFRPGDTVRPMVDNLKHPQDAKKGGIEVLKAYKGRGLVMKGITVDGPIDAPAALRGQRLLFGDLAVKVPPPAARGRPAGVPTVISADPKADAAKQLTVFASTAFRRPVDGAQVAPYVALFNDELAKGADFRQAMLTAGSAILCAPEFLFLIEQPQGKTRRLDDHAVAARLSYLFTRSAPDDELLRAAGAGELRTPSGLRAQTERLLKEPRLERFLADFTDGWLNLRDIAATTPDRKLYPEYDDQLAFAMLQETRGFLAELIARNLPASNLVRSDFAMLNERLAKHYDIPGVEGTPIRAVKLPAGNPRGGLLTQGAVLKVSANGTSTSPIIRGVYVMERVLGFQPPPPPPGVAGLEPDTRGATTIKEQLSKHRELESCNGCHQVIDPPGFALESFDVIGGWRDRVRSLDKGDRIKADRFGQRVGYKLGPAVDPSGDLVGAGTFKDFEEFRALLAKQQERITANLLSRVLAFGTGREMGFSDRAVISRLVKQAGPDAGVRDLLHLAVQSEIFLSK
jgi:mono/diheme cytochrome c family protein